MRNGFCLLLVVFAIAWIPAAGAAAPPERPAAEALRLRIIPTRVASVAEAGVAQRGEDLIVAGKVRKFHPFFLPGHVDIILCNGQGTLLASGTAKLTGHASKRGGVREGRFSATFRLVSPPGARVYVRYHPPGSREAHLDCTENT
jgi:hypothetical protein